MDHGPYILGAYGFACAALIGLTAFTLLRLRHWAKRARDEEKR